MGVGEVGFVKGDFHRPKKSSAKKWKPLPRGKNQVFSRFWINFFTLGRPRPSPLHIPEFSDTLSSSMNYSSPLLILGLLAAMGVNGWICRHFYMRMSEQVLLTLVSLFYFLQVGWLFIFVLMSGWTGLVNTVESVPDLNESPFRVPLGLTVMPIVALLVARSLSTQRAQRVELLQAVNSRHIRSFEYVLCVFACGGMFYYLGYHVKFLSEKVPYLSAVFAYAHYSFLMTPALIGLCWRRYRLPVVVFACSTVVTAVFSFAGGSRSLLFLPLVYFGVGIWLTLNNRNRLMCVALALLLATPVFYASALIETVRKEGTRDVDRELFARMTEVLSLAIDAGGVSRTLETVNQGVGRMIMWCSIAALHYSPEWVEYRGFEDFWWEVKYINRSTLFLDSSDYLEDLVEKDFGMGSARIYGFSVSAGGTVPVPILADGWSRDGLAGVMLFSVLACSCWGMVERQIRRKFVDQPHLVLTLIAILASSAYERMGTYGFVYNLRYLVMQVLLWGGLAFLLSKFLVVVRLTNTDSGGQFGSGGRMQKGHERLPKA